MSVQNPNTWSEKRTLQGLLELFLLVFHGGEKNQTFFSKAFLCLFFITAQQKGFQWPGKWEHGLRWSKNVVSISWGCQNTPAIESSSSKWCQTWWSCVGLALASFKWSSQHVTWYQFDAIKHFKWNWSCPFSSWLRGDNQLCHCFPLFIPAKFELQLGIFLVWFVFTPRGLVRAKLFVFFLDQSGCESDYSRTADRVSGRTRELPSDGSRLSPRRSPCQCQHPVPCSGEAVPPVVGPSPPFLWRNPEQRRWGGMHQVSAVRPFPCTNLLSRPLGHLPGAIPGPVALTTAEGGLLILEVWPQLRSIVMPFVDFYCLLKARASIESHHLCTFLEALGYLTAVAETPKSSPSKCHRVRRGSSGAKSRGSCLEYLWHGAREDWAGGTREYLLKSHKTFLVNQNSGNYSACWPGLGI